MASLETHATEPALRDMTISLHIPGPNTGLDHPLAAGWTLSAGSQLGEGAAAGDQRSKARKSWVRLAAAISAILHIVFLLPIFTSPSSHEPPAQIGNDGPERLEVSIVSMADLTNPGTDAIRQDAAMPQQSSSDPEPAADANAAQQQQHANDTQQAQERQGRVLETNPFVPSEPSGFQTRFNAQDYAAQVSAEFTQGLRNALARAEAQQRSAEAQTSHQPAKFAARNIRAFRPNASHGRQSDGFERDVYWALAGTVPQGNGTYGSTIVTFTVSPAGKVQDLTMIKSSGDKWLDTGALMAVRQATLPVPPSGLTAGDRTFHVEYLSRP